MTENVFAHIAHCQVSCSGGLGQTGLILRMMQWIIFISQWFFPSDAASGNH